MSRFGPLAGADRVLALKRFFARSCISSCRAVSGVFKKAEKGKNRLGAWPTGRQGRDNVRIVPTMRDGQGRKTWVSVEDDWRAAAGPTFRSSLGQAARRAGDGKDPRASSAGDGGMLRPTNTRDTVATMIRASRTAPGRNRGAVGRAADDPIQGLTATRMSRSARPPSINRTRSRSTCGLAVVSQTEMVYHE